MIRCAARADFISGINDRTAGPVRLDRRDQKLALNEAFRMQLASGWTAGEGDVLEVLATFKVTSGINYDYSMARSAPFIVTGPGPEAAAPASG